MDFSRVQYEFLLVDTIPDENNYRFLIVGWD
jgi:hypothetical protein